MSGNAKKRIEEAAAKEARLRLEKLNNYVSNPEPAVTTGCLNANRTKITLANGRIVNARVVGNPTTCGPCVKIASDTYLMEGPKPKVIQTDADKAKGYIIVNDSSGGDYFIKDIERDTLYSLDVLTIIGTPSDIFSVFSISFLQYGKHVVCGAFVDNDPGVTIYWGVLKNFRLTSNENDEKVVEGTLVQGTYTIASGNVTEAEEPDEPEFDLTFSSDLSSGGTAEITYEPEDSETTELLVTPETNTLAFLPQFISGYVNSSGTPILNIYGVYSHTRSKSLLFRIAESYTEDIHGNYTLKQYSYGSPFLDLGFVKRTVSFYHETLANLPDPPDFDANSYDFTEEVAQEALVYTDDPEVVFDPEDRLFVDVDGSITGTENLCYRRFRAVNFYLPTEGEEVNLVNSPLLATNTNLVTGIWAVLSIGDSPQFTYQYSSYKRTTNSVELDEEDDGGQLTQKIYYFLDEIINEWELNASVGRCFPVNNTTLYDWIDYGYADPVAANLFELQNFESQSETLDEYGNPICVDPFPSSSGGETGIIYTSPIFSNLQREIYIGPEPSFTRSFTNQENILIDNPGISAIETEIAEIIKTDLGLPDEETLFSEVTFGGRGYKPLKFIAIYPSASSLPDINSEFDYILIYVLEYDPETQEFSLKAKVKGTKGEEWGIGMARQDWTIK